MSDWDKFFNDEKETPSAYSIGRGRYSGLSISGDLFKRDEGVIVKTAKKYGFSMFKNRSSYHFETKGD